MVSNNKLTQIAHVLENKVPEVDLKIIRYLQEKKEATIKEICEELSKSESTHRSKPTISRRISLLEQEGLVIKIRDGKNTNVKWIGGVATLENNLQTATLDRLHASVIAENYDLLVLDPFSIFSLLFEGNCWEVFMNLRVGLNDVEISQRVGNAITLDTVRRVLVICGAHNIIKTSVIREPAGDEITKLFEPLYKIESVNREFLEYLVIIRGIASAMSLRIEGKTVPEYLHVYDSLVETIVPMYLELKDKMLSTTDENESEILKNMVSNYDFAPDIDRLYKHENWRKRVKNSKNLHIDEKSDYLLISKRLSDNTKNAMAARITKNAS